MQRMVSKVWKPSPLPLQFHLSLENGQWEDALRVYQNHPYHAPPVDTYELLKTLLYKTNLKVEEIRERFESRMRVNLSAQRRAPEQVEWGRFWNALNAGDSRTISTGLSGARIHGVAAQTGVAEACAVLLTAVGKRWKKELVDEVPYATVTKNNLITVALQKGRWDVAVEVLQYARVTRGDMLNMWPMLNRFNWQVGLLFTSRCPKSAVSFGVVLPQLLQSGCSLNVLSEHLERAKVLGDVEVVAPLLRHAVKVGEWDFVVRAMEHLEDIGCISTAAHRVFAHLCDRHGPEKVVKSIVDAGLELHTIEVSDLEEISGNY